MKRLFLTYAQHGEDVILWRALGHRDKVTYVDVGAFDPTEDSVTRALYERGWRGVNVEVQADRIRAFEEQRPEDVNVSVAIGDHDGEATLTLPGNPGWASVRDTADVLAPGASADVKQVTVPMRTLATLLPELGLATVDVLKIDVEGAEADVVRGLLDGAVRPTVCVVEGLSPAFGAAAGEEAVALLVEAGYIHCMFDGLNHYLTTDPSLVEALSVPANPLDEFMDFRLAHLIEWSEGLEPGALSQTAAPPVGATADLRQVRRRETLLRLLVTQGAGAAGGTAGGTDRGLDPAALEEAPPAVAVGALYRGILGREPDATGLAIWSARLEEGLSRLALARRLYRSAEGKALSGPRRKEIRQLFKRWRAFHNLVEIGADGVSERTYTPGRARAEIFVHALYEAALDRAPSEEEVAEHVAELASGTSRDAVLRGLARRRDVRDRLRSAGSSTTGRRPSWAGGVPLDELRERVAEAEIRSVAGLVSTYAGFDRELGRR